MLGDLDDDVWDGVNSLLDNYAEVRPGDVVIVVYTADSRAPAAWVSIALESRGLATKRVWMAPVRDEGFLDRFRLALPSPTEVSGRLIIMTFERDTMSHTDAFRRVLYEYDDGRCIVIRAISACAALFSHALRASPGDLSARNAAILARCMAATTLRIETSSGTNLEVKLDASRYHWVSNRAVSRPGRFILLPAGEVATFPASIHGRLVADFAFNVNAITDLDARLDSHPVTVTVEHDHVVDYKCDNGDVCQLVAQCFGIPNAKRVGELGFGTNFALDAAIPMNSHINERRPGVHLGFGNHNQPNSAVGYSCQIHLDLIAKGGRIWIDADPIPIDLENVSPSSEPHPTHFYDEDLSSPDYDPSDGDCCGLLGNDARSSSHALASPVS